MKFFNCAEKFVTQFILYASKLESILLLIIRLWVANIFWKSGYLKISDFDSAIMLFTTEHPVPFLPPLIAAISAVIFELGCSVFLVIGLATRFAVIPLLMMTAVIQFTYFMHDDHFYWAVLLGVLLARGAGIFSVDHLIKKSVAKNRQ